MRLKLKPYPEYKDSGLSWLGEIPAHWSGTPIRAFTKLKNLRERPDLSLLSVYREFGVIKRDSRDDNYNRKGENLASYKVVSSGDLVINKMKTWQGSLGVSEYEGTVSPAYIVCEVSSDCNRRYLHSLLRSRSYITRYNQLSFGVRVSQWDMRYQDFKQIVVFFPRIEEQDAIVRFLHHITDRINRLIRIKQRLLKLLNEQKQAIINRAVTRGLDPNVRLKPSGVDWIGDVPEHWTISALRLFYSVQLGKMLDAKRILGHSLIPYLRNTDVQWDKINTTNLPLMDIEPAEYDRYTVQPGDLLVCEGGDVGRSAFWNGGELALCGYQKALHRVRPLSSERSVPRFLYYVMYAASKCGVFLAGGSENTIAHLTCEKLRAHRFAFPNIQAQQAIVQYLDSVVADIEVTITRARREIELIREYRTRLVADVVTGKLDVRGVELPVMEETEELEGMDNGDELEAAEPDETEEPAYADD